MMSGPATFAGVNYRRRRMMTDKKDSALTLPWPESVAEVLARHAVCETEVRVAWDEKDPTVLHVQLDRKYTLTAWCRACQDVSEGSEEEIRNDD